MANDLIKSILEVAEIQQLEVDFSQLKIINRETAEKIQTLVFAKEKTTLKILTTNNYTNELKKLQKQLEDKGYKQEMFYTSVEGFQEALKRYDQLAHQENLDQEKYQAQKQAEGKSAIKVIKELFETRISMDPGDFIMEVVRLAFQSGASDLHLQPEENDIVFRIRLDGVLQDIISFDQKDFRKYLQKLKFIAGVKMNIDYLPQDGRFSFDAIDPKGNARKVDARVNFMPGLSMESTVLRFLDANKGVSTFEEIGFTGANYEILKRNISKNTGIIIITGPTGSGKTTTLYSILHKLNTGTNKIITLEDPVEYEVKGIQQSQIDYTKGYDYETGLKAILRHDPDIILVGETRSKETAEISINAALTGHLVFTTLHTNSAIDTISRLLSMEVKPYLLAPALHLIVGQRLVRQICPHCAIWRDASYAEDAEIQQFIQKIKDINPQAELPYEGKVIQPGTCEQCNNSGFVGRIAILELFEINDDIRGMIIDGKNSLDLYLKARQNGFISMQEDGMLKALKGLTTLEEVHRVS